MKKILCIAGCALALGCAMPSTTVRMTDLRPSLALSGAAPGEVLFVDGLQVGEARAFDGQPMVLRVEPGTHDVDVRTPEGQVVFRQRVFVESELKTIEVH